jgi:hypothetical protein
MKARLSFAFAVLVLSFALTPAPAASVSTQCSSFCATVRCIGGYVCGLYTNSSGQTVCGCHPGLGG